MEIQRLFDLLEKTQKRGFREVVFAGKEGGEWKKYSSDEYYEFAYNISYALIHLGIHPGDKVITITSNRPEWNILDMGIMMCGAVHVPVYPTISENDYRYIMNHSEAKLVFTAGKELYDRVKPIAREIPAIIDVYTFKNINGDKHFGELVELGAKNPQPEKVEEIKNMIRPDDVATIIYTSGTTGNPKGVMLSHANILSNVYDTYTIPSPGTERVLSFLPMCHVYERMMNYMYQFNGFSIYYVENLANISDFMEEVKPHIITTVPRLLESIFDKIMAKGRKLKFPVKQIFFWAVNLGLKYKDVGNSFWFNFQLFFARKLVFKKWQKALGGELDIIVSGGAALQMRLARVFWAAGFRVLEGYGLTETSPVIAVNRFEKNGIKFGTVGLPLDSVQVKIAQDGEIMTRGPHVMKGYFKEPQLTAEVMTDDGWFKTGDIGVLEPGGHLRITDRKKEIFKTSAGKYIAPQVLENKFKESPFIEQLIVLGENQKYAAALIVPNFIYLKSWCEVKGIEYTSDAGMTNNTEIRKRFQKEIDSFNKNFGEWEQIARFELLPSSWSTASGELTPTLKLKRSFIVQEYASQAEKLFELKKK
jgi:long-chain acyl-CoA synthetase